MFSFFQMRVDCLQLLFWLLMSRVVSIEPVRGVQIASSFQNKTWPHICWINPILTQRECKTVPVVRWEGCNQPAGLRQGVHWVMVLILGCQKQIFSNVVTHLLEWFIMIQPGVSCQEVRQLPVTKHAENILYFQNLGSKKKISTSQLYHDTSWTQHDVLVPLPKVSGQGDRTC